MCAGPVVFIVFVIVCFVVVVASGCEVASALLPDARTQEENPPGPAVQSWSAGAVTTWALDSMAATISATASATGTPLR